MGARGPKGDKLITDALRLAMKREAKTAGPDGKARTRVHAMAEAMAELAETGDQFAVTFVTDRLEGKPHQATSLEADINHTVDQTKSDADAFRDRLLSRHARGRTEQAPEKPH